MESHAISARLYSFRIAVRSCSLAASMRQAIQNQSQFPASLGLLNAGIFPGILLL